MASGGEVILIVDDEIQTAEYHASLVRDLGYLPLIETNPNKVITRLEKDPTIQVLLLDLRMPSLNGIEVLKLVRRHMPHIGVIIATVVNDIAEAVQATKHGAYNYLLKPLQFERLQRVLYSFLHHRPESLLGDKRFRSFVTAEPSFQEIFRRMSMFAEQDVPVLVWGETGTGKEIAAELIHAISPRQLSPFVPINMSAIAPGLFESELFGHVRGAFTGSHTDKVGYFQRAADGTLFIDEIGELPLEHQAKLLRVLQSRKFCKVGSSVEQTLHARLIFATNRDLKSEVSKGNFREDLYYRISNHTIFLPPLRERPKDVALLTQYFIHKYNAQYGRWIEGASDEALLYLKRYRFDGNVRELEGVVSAAVLLEQASILTPKSLPPHILNGLSVSPSQNLKHQLPLEESTENLTLMELKKKQILDMLKECDGNQTQASAKLGIARGTLNRLLRRYKQEDSVSESRSEEDSLDGF